MKQYPRSMSRRERALALEWTSKGMYAAYEETAPFPPTREIQQDATLLATQAGYSDQLHALIRSSWLEGYQRVKQQTHEQRTTLARVLFALPYPLALSRLILSCAQA